MVRQEEWEQKKVVDWDQVGDHLQSPKGNRGAAKHTRAQESLGLIGILCSDQGVASMTIIYAFKKFPLELRKNRQELGLKMKCEWGLKKGPLTLYNAMLKILMWGFRVNQLIELDSYQNLA